MAKSIDASKLEPIKESTVELVVSHGYNAASVSLIAKRAGVADGYLYRFYNSKYDLVSDIFKDKVETLVDYFDYLYETKSSIKEIVHEFVAYIMNRAKEFPVQIKFLFMLIHDYNFEINIEVANRLKTTFEKLLDKGKNNDEINEHITSEDLYVLIIGQSLLYIDSRYRNHFGHREFDDAIVSRVANLCFKAIN